MDKDYQIEVLRQTVEKLEKINSDLVDRLNRQKQESDTKVEILEDNLKTLASFFELEEKDDIKALKSLSSIKILKDKIKVLNCNIKELTKERNSLQGKAEKYAKKIEALNIQLSKKNAYIKILERLITVINKISPLSEHVDRVDTKTQEVLSKFIKEKNKVKKAM